MNADFIQKTIKASVLLMLFLCFGFTVRAAFVPVVVSGYNADVVANGPGVATGSITADVDGAGYAFMAADFNPLGALPTAYLPQNGMVYSVATSGVTFQLGSYAANNSLRLAATASGTLSLQARNPPQIYTCWAYRAAAQARRLSP